VHRYRLRPEPGPVGVNVDPLGEPEGASVFPDGFVVVLGPVRALLARPVVDPGGCVIELLFTDEPGVAPVAAEPPVPELPPDIPPLLLLCASATVLESASAPANAIVMSFMVVSLVEDLGKTSTGGGCSSNSDTKTSANSADGQTGKSMLFRSEPAKRLAPVYRLPEDKRAISRASEECASSTGSRCDRSR
jgi:hypothetical protein